MSSTQNIYNISLLYRYFETGYCKGFLSRGIQLLKQHYGNIQDSEIYPWCVYTDKDVELYSDSPKCSTNQGKLNFSNHNLKAVIYHPSETNLKHIYTITDYTDQYKRKVGHDAGKRANKMAIMSQLSVLKPKLVNVPAVLFVHKTKPNPNIKSHR